MKIFKPKNPVRTLVRLLDAGKRPYEARYRLMLWEIRYERSTGKAPVNAPALNNFRQNIIDCAP